MSTAHLHTAGSAVPAAQEPRKRVPGSQSAGRPVASLYGARRDRYRGRTGWVAVVNVQTFPDGRTYAEVGVSWHIRSDWAKADGDAWFRVDELEAM